MTQGYARGGFDVDCARFSVREDVLRHILEEAKIEVKSDRQCCKTGNVYIEYSQTSGPSGISTTEADYWAIEFGDGCFVLMPTDRLRDLVREAHKKFGTTRGGDFNKQKGVLVPWDWLRKEM